MRIALMRLPWKTKMLQNWPVETFWSGQGLPSAVVAHSPALDDDPVLVNHDVQAVDVVLNAAEVGP